MSADIEWGAPPAKMTTGGPKPDARWLSVAAALRSRPGEWALVAEQTTRATATNIVNGRIVAFRDGVFEATSRAEAGDPTRVRIYARYVGESA